MEHTLGVERVQFLARLEAYGLPRSNGNFGSGARIATDACLSWAHGEDAKAAQFDSFATFQRIFQRLKNGFDRRFAFVAGQTRPLDYLMNDVLLNQGSHPGVHA